MLPKVSIGRHCGAVRGNIENYRILVGDELIDEVLDLARRLSGIRICHINSTPFGGGVAELLARYLPILQDLGLSADWRLIHGTPDFFTVTKAFHNALQGAEYELKEPQQALYLGVNEQSAKLLTTEYDVFIVHDPQPAAIRHFAGPKQAKWIWRCHIDSSVPNTAVRQFLQPFIEEYDASIFTMAEFLLPGLRSKHLALIPPAIDPLATKNMDIPLDLCKRAISDSGVDVNRPLLLQVSRFDPWKDPMGAIQAYRLVKKDFPGVQLVLIGAMAGDDPEGWELFEQVEEEAAKDP
ncbi:MAG: glycosyl transferase family 1, partial [Desulfobacterales bacterium]|nr:glycosyl transferase family 1 [Desulfobacterales bacterium]